MTPGLWLALAMVAAVAVLALLAALAARAARGRRRLEESLAASREELLVLQRRLDALAQQVPSSPPARRRSDEETEYVITSAGADSANRTASDVPAVPVSAARYASLAVGESLVRLVSLGYGVRRAMSAENRNRIGFEVRREVRRARKQRRREEKQGRRYLREAGQDAA
jgi:type II secretory pathway component PulJ